MSVVVMAVTLHSHVWWQTVKHKEKVRHELLSLEGAEEMATCTKLIGEPSDKCKYVL